MFSNLLQDSPGPSSVKSRLSFDPGADGGQYIDLNEFLWLVNTWQRFFISALHTDRDGNTHRGLWLVNTGHVTRILASDWLNSSLTYCIFSQSPEGTMYLPLRIPDIWCFLSLRIKVKTLCRNKTLVRSTQAPKLFISEKNVNYETVLFIFISLLCPPLSSLLKSQTIILLILITLNSKFIPNICIKYLPQAPLLLVNAAGVGKWQFSQHLQLSKNVLDIPFRVSWIFWVLSVFPLVIRAATKMAFWVFLTMHYLESPICISYLHKPKTTKALRHIALPKTTYVWG